MLENLICFAYFSKSPQSFVTVNFHRFSGSFCLSQAAQYFGQVMLIFGLIWDKLMETKLNRCVPITVSFQNCLSFVVTPLEHLYVLIRRSLVKFWVGHQEVCWIGHWISRRQNANEYLDVNYLTNFDTLCLRWITNLDWWIKNPDLNSGYQIDAYFTYLSSLIFML